MPNYPQSSPISEKPISIPFVSLMKHGHGQLGNHIITVPLRIRMWFFLRPSCKKIQMSANLLFLNFSSTTLIFLMCRYGRWILHEKYWLKLVKFQLLVDGLNWFKMHHLQSKFLKINHLMMHLMVILWLSYQP